MPAQSVPRSTIVIPQAAMPKKEEDSTKEIKEPVKESLKEPLKESTKSLSDSQSSLGTYYYYY